MTYRAWEQKPLDRTAVRELTAAIAEQAAAQLEEQAMDEAPWSDEKYKAVLAAQQQENALLAGLRDVYKRQGHGRNCQVYAAQPRGGRLRPF